jgi:ATP-binding cassette subfamily B protein AbcA/BmrA
MLSGSIRENLLYGLNRTVTQDEIDQALEHSRCDEFVGRLEKGLDTQIGEQGILLSGGQRQRIALGRMFLRNPDILLLDEATSQLDEENEHLIVQGLKALMDGRTTIFVTHRLALVEHMDRIVMLESGQISGAGDHSALLASNQAYRRVATRAFVPEIAA